MIAKKLLDRLQRKPKDFTWHELEKLLGQLGYEPIKRGKTGGSRRKFVHERYAMISLHKPHPGNVLKRYQVDQILELFKQEEII